MIPRTEFSDGTITIKPFELSDVPALVEAVRESVPEIQPWMEWCHADYNEKEAQRRLKILPECWDSGLQYAFTIVNTQGLDIQDGMLLGGCSLNHIHPFYRLADLSCWVRTSRTRQGIASRATRLLARFAFEQLSLVRVEIVVALGNQASQRAAQKAGAHREGILRNRVLIRDEIQDAVMFSLIPEDFDLNPTPKTPAISIESARSE